MSRPARALLLRMILLLAFCVTPSAASDTIDLRYCSIFVASYGSQTGETTWLSSVDYDRDSRITSEDLFRLARSFGARRRELHPEDTGLLVNVSLPFPATSSRAENADSFRAALQQIKIAIPRVHSVGLGFLNDSTVETDWKTFLDVCDSEQLKATVSFVAIADSDAAGFRPYRDTGGNWVTGSLGRFLQDTACVQHPALYFVQICDEPWHEVKTPQYSAADLLSLYTELRGLMPPGSAAPLQLQFSRELWKYIHDQPAPQVRWDTGMCDIVQISALEFQDTDYQASLLDSNHQWSRRIVHETTPQIPMWSSAQVFGTGIGPRNGYWFPRVLGADTELERLLDDLNSHAFFLEHRLTGIMLQQWDSVDPDGRSGQYTLGDAYLAGQPVAQATTSNEAIAELNTWLDGQAP